MPSNQRTGLDACLNTSVRLISFFSQTVERRRPLPSPSLEGQQQFAWVGSRTLEAHDDRPVLKRVADGGGEQGLV